MIPVTKTYLPSIDEFTAILQRAWESGWITNRGHLVLELEEKLKQFLGVEYITTTANGTLPLQIAIKALNLYGEIITTPFSYVATTSSIVWEGCVPVFVDIDPNYLTIDENKIEAAINANTSAILATHVFGNPCNVTVIESIAKKHGLKVIYDAAHCFGVKYQNKSIFNYGDVSTCSFHATKLFHTGEGGAMITSDEDLHNKLFSHHNFGHLGLLDFQGLGINAKLSELHAAMGLAILPYISNLIEIRKNIVDAYSKHLQDLELKFIQIRPGTEWNYHYYPVIFNSETQLKRIEQALRDKNINPRRYFHPSLNTLNYVTSDSMPISESIAGKILCLPLYDGLTSDQIELICDTVKEHLK